MGRYRSGLALIAVYAFSGIATAQVYKCSVDGATEFQDTPCRGAGPVVQQAPSRSTARVASVVAQSASGLQAAAMPTNAERMNAQIASIVRERQLRDLAYTIRNLEIDIDRYDASMESEFAALHAKKGNANNNLAGAAREQSISGEMSAAAAKWKIKIGAAQGQLRKLRTDHAALLAVK